MALISKMCSSLLFGKRENNLLQKTEFLRTWKISQKIVFLRKNLWELLDARVLHTFESRVLAGRPAGRTDASAPLLAGAASPPPPLLAWGRENLLHPEFTS